MLQQEEEISQHREQKRRTFLKQGFGAAVAVAGIGTAAAMQATSGTTHANGAETATQFADTVSPVVSVQNKGVNGDGIVSNASGSGTAISGLGITGTGVSGASAAGVGVSGFSGRNAGVIGTSNSGTGVIARANGTGATALDIQGPIKVGTSSSVANSPVGTATLAIGAKSVTVTNPVATPNSLVIITPQSNPGGTLWVTTAAGSFTIHRNSNLIPVFSRVTIAYLIIN